ncbi:MAG TPA: DNA translocase FtsK [Rectinema sp.]|nr:DNA translocase FtsK [Rectinema sp.]
MEAKKKTHPKASVVVAKKPAARRGSSTSIKASARSSALRSTRGIIALIFFIVALFLFISMLLWSYFPTIWRPLVLPGQTLLNIFSWAAYYLPLWLAWAAILVYVPSFCPRMTYLLGTSALPFVVATGFARLSANPGSFFEHHPSMAKVGLSSLYAALGFLLAASLMIVIAGYIKLSEWLRANGFIKTRADKKKNGEEQSFGQRLATFIKDNSLKREERRKRKEEARLARARALAEKDISLNIPDVPPPDPLKSEKLGGFYASGTSRAGSEMVQKDLGATSVPMGSAIGSTGLSLGSRSLGPIAGFDTGGISFTSVPPARPAQSEEEHKRAIVERILERKAAKPYQVPIDGLLNNYPDGQYWIIDEKTRASASVLKETLAEFGIEAEVTGIRKGPVITMFEILPAHGVKISKITNLSDNIALRLAASSVRIVAPIPGKHAVGIEVPNERRAIVSLRELIESEKFRQSKMEIPVALGKDIAGEVQLIDLTQMPHILIAGATGSGKSVCVNSIILSILYKRTPEEVRLMLIDPKIVELKLYNDIPHLLTPVVTEAKKAFQALQYCICEMERRYSLLDNLGVRDIRSYNRRIRERNLAQDKVPYIVVIIDEFADLMQTTGKELEATLARLAAMSRAVGIHLVLATQRPSIDVITGLIKANIPSRIAFMVASKFDSRTIIDMVGAEKLLGRGDMLFSGAQDPFPVRMQGAFVSEEEVERVVAHVKTLGEPEYIDEEIFVDEEESEEPTLFDEEGSDPLFEKALEIVLQQGKASVSYIQRRLKIGFNRAARLVEMMEEKGIVGPAQGSKPRDVLRNPGVFESSSGYEGIRKDASPDIGQIAGTSGSPSINPSLNPSPRRTFRQDDQDN